MKKLDGRTKILWTTSIVILSLFVSICGCAPSLKLTKPFPAPMPEQAEVSIHLNGQGGFYVEGKDGEIVVPECTSFSSLVENARIEEEDWMRIFGSFRLYQIKERGMAWICDDEFKCAIGRYDDKKDAAVFSINYDGKELFLSQASGDKVKEFVPFAEIVKEVGIGKEIGLHEIGIITLFQIKSSIKWSWTTADNRYYCLCIFPDGHWTGCTNGQCP